MYNRNDNKRKIERQKAKIKNIKRALNIKNNNNKGGYKNGNK